MAATGSPREEDDPGRDGNVQRRDFACHRNADERVAIPLYQVVQALSFSAHDDYSFSGPIHCIVSHVAFFVESIDEVTVVLQRAQCVVDIHHLHHRQMFEGARGGFGDGLGKSRGAAFGDDYSVGAGGMGGADNCPEIVRIFDAIEDDEEFGGGRDVVQIGVLLFGAERDDSLMRFHAGETIERAAVLKPYGGVSGAGEIDDFLQAVASGTAGDEDAFEGTPGAQGFDDGVNSN